MKKNMYIEIVRAHDVHFSSMGLKSGEMIKATLSKYYSDVRLSTISDRADLRALVARNPDLVILGLKRVQDKNLMIWVSEFLDQHNINYTGSVKSAMELDLNKARAKTIMQQHDIPTSDFFTARPGQFETKEKLPLNFPLFIKPHNQGGGMGIGPDSIARKFSDFEEKVASIFAEYNTFALVENYLEGREFSVALLGSGYGAELMVMPIELITTPNKLGDRILGQAVKSEDNERAIAITDSAIHTQVSDLARVIYKTLGARDYGRIDMRMDKHGKAHFMEANLTPGIANNDFVSYFMRACELNQNMDYKDVILSLTELALARNNERVISPLESDIVGAAKRQLVQIPRLNPVVR